MWWEGFRARAQSASGTVVDAIPRRRRSGHQADPGDAASRGADPSQAHPGRKQYRPVAGRSDAAGRSGRADERRHRHRLGALAAPRRAQQCDLVVVAHSADRQPRSPCQLTDLQFATGCCHDPNAKAWRYITFKPLPRKIGKRDRHAGVVRTLRSSRWRHNNRCDTRALPPMDRRTVKRQLRHRSQLVSDDFVWSLARP